MVVLAIITEQQITSWVLWVGNSGRAWSGSSLSAVRQWLKPPTPIGVFEIAKGWIGISLCSCGLRPLHRLSLWTSVVALEQLDCFRGSWGSCINVAGMRLKLPVFSNLASEMTPSHLCLILLVATKWAPKFKGKGCKSYFSMEEESMTREKTEWGMCALVPDHSPLVPVQALPAAFPQGLLLYPSLL